LLRKRLISLWKPFNSQSSLDEFCLPFYRDCGRRQDSFKAFSFFNVLQFLGIQILCWRWLNFVIIELGLQLIIQENIISLKSVLFRWYRRNVSDIPSSCKRYWKGIYFNSIEISAENDDQNASVEFENSLFNVNSSKKWKKAVECFEKAAKSLISRIFLVWFQFCWRISQKILFILWFRFDSTIKWASLFSFWTLSSNNWSRKKEIQIKENVFNFWNRTESENKLNLYCLTKLLFLIKKKERIIKTFPVRNLKIHFFSTNILLLLEI
jgi:hypothetical protein